MIDFKNTGLYIHIPFCRSKCPYCSFYSFRPDKEIIDKYTNKICKDISIFNGSFETVYFGGGTPSFIGTNRLTPILNCLNLSETKEITIECNPYDLTRSDDCLNVSELKKNGVNRISLGMQSAVDIERKTLGRLSGKNDVSKAIELCQKSGIDNISLDLMIGTPEQTLSGLKESLDFCIKSNIKHISAYILKIEEGTFFDLHREKYKFPEEDETADYYLYICDYLKKNGFIHYEVSNFSLPGYESNHNLRYWQLKDYIGIGPAAHSFIEGKRFYYPDDINEFLSGTKPLSDGNGGDLYEYIMLSLRYSKGIIFDEIKTKYNFDLSDEFIDKCKYFENQSLGVLTDNNFRLTDNGYLLSNKIILELTELID